MNGSRRVNPLHVDGLTIDTVKTNDHIICWRPNNPASTRHLTVLCDPYTDDDGDLVVEVRHADGHETIELTSEVGLSGYRHTGEWTTIAVADEETD